MKKMLIPVIMISFSMLSSMTFAKDLSDFPEYTVESIGSIKAILPETRMY